MALLRLIRLPNLIIVALTQAILYFHLLFPYLQHYQIPSIFQFSSFVLFSFVTIVISAAGYIINDITDIRVDLINKPDKVVINKSISLQTAYWLYFCTCLIGYAASLFLAFDVMQLALINIYILAVGGLYWYSNNLKKKALLGNILVAIYCAGVAGILWFADRNAIQILQKLDPAAAHRVKSVFMAYMVFAFLVTLYRELIKDIEDLKGDEMRKYRTAPILWGIGPAKAIAALIGGLLCVSILIAAWKFVPPFLALLVLPVLLSLYLLKKASNSTDYHQLSLYTKWLMLGSLLILWTA